MSSMEPQEVAHADVVVNLLVQHEESRTTYQIKLS